MSKYILERRVGEGGMAEVFRARNAQTGEPCAIKRLLPELRRDARFQARFIDEARIAGRLKHPNILSVVDFYEDAGIRHIVMELVEGASVDELIDGSLFGLFVPIPVTAAIVAAIAGALEYAHKQGVLHRDVSACNVLVSDAGEIKLADFGLADAVGRLAATEPGSIAGRIKYLSPARQRGEKATAADDAFALGVLTRRLLAAVDPRERAGSDGRKLSGLRDQLASPKWQEAINAVRHLSHAQEGEIAAHVREIVAQQRGRYSPQRVLDHSFQ